MILRLAMLTIISGCAIVPKYELKPRDYCKREDYTYVCPGYSQEKSNIEWLSDGIRGNQ